MSPAEAGQLAVKLVLALVFVYGWYRAILWVDEWVKAKRLAKTRADVQRLQKLVEIADDLDAANTVGERQKLYREAERLGFLDSDDLPHPPTGRAA